jgi:DNA-binding CsgD family transcriptional regulator
MSRSKQALLLMGNGYSAKEAAAQLGISVAAVYKARTKAAGQAICPCCGQPVKAK